MATLAEQLQSAGQRPSGFDYMRLALATAIACNHSITTAYGWPGQTAFWESPARPFLMMLMPMFFTLSGFLVAGSLERSKTIGMFLGLRAIRIFPALAVEVLISALILGPLLTHFSLSAYFADPLFRRYLLNLIGDVQFLLPGVFEKNPLPQLVNGQLWTIPYELACYVILAGLAILGGRRWRIIFPLGLFGAMGFFATVHGIRHHGDLSVDVGALPGPMLVFSFLAGLALYMYRDVVPWSLRGFVLCATLSVFGLLLATGAATGIGVYVSVLASAYVTVYLGLTNIPRIRLLRGADYSYGIFLYHFAIQQALMAVFPWAREWYWCIALSLPLVVVLSAFSWHVIEKPALSLRRYLTVAEDRILRQLAPRIA